MELKPSPAGLEVVQSGLEVAKPKSEPVGYFGDCKGNVSTVQAILIPDQGSQKRGRICGQIPSTSYLSAALILVILLAGIGGGVGGTIAVNDVKK